MTIFLAQPDRYGRFGHQFTSLLSAYLCARFFNQTFIPLKLAYFAEKWNTLFDWEKSEYAAKNIVSSNISFIEDMNTCHLRLNRKLKWVNTSSIYSSLYAEVVKQEKENLCILAFDQKPGLLINLISHQSDQDLLNTLNYKLVENVLGNISLPKDPFICMHLRRGDVDSTSHPSWYIPDPVVLSLFEKLTSCVDNEIILITEESYLSPVLRSYISAHKQFNIASDMISAHIGSYDKDIYDWIIMLKAQFLIGSKSSFSQLAHLFGLSERYFNLSLDNDFGQLTKKFQTIIPVNSNLDWSRLVSCISNHIE